MDNFLDTNYLSTLNQEATNSKLIITTNYIKTLAKSLSNKENLGQDWFTARFYQTFKCNQTLIRLKVLHKTEEKVILLNILWALLIQIKTKTKNRKDLTKKENYKITFPMNILNVILIKRIKKHGEPDSGGTRL